MIQPRELTEEDIYSLEKKSIWDFSNQILYDLCKNNFRHDKIEQILTKVLFIGRIYAAAVERFKKAENSANVEELYNSVGNILKGSELDVQLAGLTKYENINDGNINEILHTHFYLIRLLEEISKHKKRSFCSKYLHFHLPHLFFIYDSKADAALRKLKLNIPNDLNSIIKDDEYIDNDYATFFCKCYNLKAQIKRDYNIDLTNRQIDNLLLRLANNAT